MTGGPGCQYLSNLREGEQLQKLMVLAISLDYDWWSCTHPSNLVSGLARPANSDQVALRHPQGSAYGCFLPDLTRFTDLRRAGPDPQHHL